MTKKGCLSNSEDVIVPDGRTINIVYLNGYLKKTVTFSQIINWAEVFKASGISYTVMIIPGYLGYFFMGGRKIIMENVEKARSVIGNCIHILPVLKPSSFVSKVFLALMLFFRFHKILLCKEPVIFISRSSKLLLSLSFLRKLFPLVKFVFDCRGVLEEEYLLSNSSCMNNRVQIESKRMSTRILEVIRKSDLVLYVSYRLKEHYQTLSANSKNTRSIVVPTCADSSTFFFNPDMRRNVRRKYSVNDDIVLLYSGALAKRWQIPEILFRIVGILLRSNKHFRFWCLTPDTDIAIELASKNKLPYDRFMTLYSEYEVLCSFLNAADFGLLLRDTSPVNEVAAPTKFAEYLMCGLPVIISEGIGDYSSVVSFNSNLGFCINPHDSPEKSAIMITEKVLIASYDREAIAEKEKKRFSKQAFLPVLFSEIYELANVKHDGISANE